jgi:hypothetical protein
LPHLDNHGSGISYTELLGPGCLLEPTAPVETLIVIATSRHRQPIASETRARTQGHIFFKGQAGK